MFLIRTGPVRLIQPEHSHWERRPVPVFTGTMYKYMSPSPFVGQHDPFLGIGLPWFSTSSNILNGSIYFCKWNSAVPFIIWSHKNTRRKSRDVIELNVKEQPFALTAFVKQMKTALLGSISKLNYLFFLVAVVAKILTHLLFTSGLFKVKCAYEKIISV